MEREVQYENREHLTFFDKETIRKLGALGLYDASLDFYPTVHRNEELWAIEQWSNPNIIESNN